MKLPLDFQYSTQNLSVKSSQKRKLKGFGITILKVRITKFPLPQNLGQRNASIKFKQTLENLMENGKLLLIQKKKPLAYLKNKMEE